MTDPIDVVVVGAGPYGLSVAAHLQASGLSYRIFGQPMNLWRTMMPQGMYLKSQGFASNLSDPKDAKTLEAFCASTGRHYGSYGVPVALDLFIDYGLWFKEQLSLPVEEALVTSVTKEGGLFHVTVGGTEELTARQIVFAIGVEHFAFTADPFASLPDTLCTHSSGLTDPAAFADKQVIVVGSGQSALESAALLHEAGADVQLLARRATLSWNGNPLAPDRPLVQRLREPEAGLGSGYSTWFYSNQPDLFRHLPQSTRVYRAATALGPAGASWLRARVEGKFSVRTGRTVTEAAPDGDKVRLTVNGGSPREEFTADHVIAATGYRGDLARLDFLGDDLRSQVNSVNRTAAVGRGYQSSVPGLYFVGPMVAPSFGPVMRFVFGSRHAAYSVTRQLVSSKGSSRHAVGAGR